MAEGHSKAKIVHSEWEDKKEERERERGGGEGRGGRGGKGGRASEDTIFRLSHLYLY